MAHACYICNFYPVPDGEGVECPHCHRLQYGTRCPRCGQNAPTLLRGMRVFCSACGAERGPLSAMPLNVVGQPSRVGSTVTRVAAWGVMLSGFVAAMVVALIFGLIFTAGWAAATGLTVAALSVLIGMAMLRGSRALRESADSAQKHARESSIFALAANRNGSLTATDVATALNIQLSEADATLTALAREGTSVGVEIDGAGVVHYVFRELRARPGGAVRVDAGDAGGVRVDATTPSSADEAREKVDREWEQMRARSEAAKRNE